MKSLIYSNLLLLGALSSQSITSFSQKSTHPDVIILFGDQHNASVSTKDLPLVLAHLREIIKGFWCAGLAKEKEHLQNTSFLKIANK